MGNKLGAIVNPLVLAGLYFIVIAPVGIFTRALGRDPLRIKRRVCSSYWIQRGRSQRTPDEFFKQQY